MTMMKASSVYKDNNIYDSNGHIDHMPYTFFFFLFASVSAPHFPFPPFIFMYSIHLFTIYLQYMYFSTSLFVFPVTGAYRNNNGK